MIAMDMNPDPLPGLSGLAQMPKGCTVHPKTLPVVEATGNALRFAG